MVSWHLLLTMYHILPHTLFYTYFTALKVACYTDNYIRPHQYCTGHYITLACSQSVLTYLTLCYVHLLLRVYPIMLSVMQQLWTSTDSSSILYSRPDLIQTDVHSILRCRRLLVLCVLIGQGMTKCGAASGLYMSLCVNPSSIVNSWLVVSSTPLSAWLLSIINGSTYKVLHVPYAMWPLMISFTLRVRYSPWLPSISIWVVSLMNFWIWMVDDRAKAGRWTMDSLLRSAVGVLYGCTFRKLLLDLVQSVLLYGAEAWGCLRGLESMEHVQLRALLLWCPQVSQDITFFRLR